MELARLYPKMETSQTSQAPALKTPFSKKHGWCHVRFIHLYSLWFYVHSCLFFPNHGKKLKILKQQKTIPPLAPGECGHIVFFIFYFIISTQWKTFPTVPQEKLNTHKVITMWGKAWSNKKQMLACYVRWLSPGIHHAGWDYKTLRIIQYKAAFNS